MTLVVEETAVVATAETERSEANIERAETAVTSPDIRAFFDSFNPPEGVRAELIEGVIIMSPTPVLSHGRLLRDLYKSFVEGNKPENTEVPFSPVTIDLPNAPDKDCYVPDLCVIDAAAEANDAQWKVEPDAVHLVVEVVSTTSRRNDRTVKPRGYASGPIPFYLLIDPLRDQVTLFYDPVNGEYRAHTMVPFGKKINFPDPWNAILDTSIFTL